MRRRTAVGLALVAFLVLAAPAAGDTIRDRKQAVDSKIDSLQARIDRARAREGVLTTEISEVTQKIRGLEDDVSSASSQLERLEAVLALHQRKLDRLNALYRVQTRRLLFLQRQYRAAVDRLSRRIVEIYTSEEPSTLSFVLEASSFEALVDQIDYVNEIGRQDERIARAVERAKNEMAATRARTRRTRAEVAAVTEQVARRTDEQRQVRDRLVATQNELAAARSQKRNALASVRESKEELIAEVDALLAVSAELAAKIQAAQAANQSAGTVPSRAPSAAGFVWPVNGPVTSVFGMRWGRMHEGIDIAVPSGTPVVAAASGVVIWAGWMGGYGNLVVVDHGGGLATAYGHNSSVTVGVGQSVSQGQLIAYSGSTGQSTGPHVHFEVRVGGAAVDPLGYL